MKRTALFFAVFCCTGSQAAFSVDCYSESTEIAGSATGTPVTDKDQLETDFDQLSQASRSAGVRSCTSLVDSTLRGIQIGVVDYSTLSSDYPTSDELLWLPGLGDVTADDELTCEEIIIPRTAGLTTW